MRFEQEVYDKVDLNELNPRIMNIILEMQDQYGKPSSAAKSVKMVKKLDKSRAFQQILEIYMKKQPQNIQELILEEANEGR